MTVQTSAAPGTATGPDADTLQFVSFVVAGEEFGIDILRVQEIIRPVPVTRVPHAPPAVDGVVNLRGRIVPVVDARRRFGLPPRTDEGEGRVVVVEVGGRTVGLVMDAVREVIRIPRSAIEPAPDLSVGVGAEYVRGVARVASADGPEAGPDRLVIVLDVERVLGDDDQAALDDLVDEA